MTSVLPQLLVYLAYVLTVGVACAAFVYRDRDGPEGAARRRWMAVVLVTGLLGFYLYLTRDV